MTLDLEIALWTLREVSRLTAQAADLQQIPFGEFTRRADLLCEARDLLAEAYRAFESHPLYERATEADRRDALLGFEESA